SAIEPKAIFTVLSGESGQGKTWALCHAALTQAKRGDAAVVIPAPSTFEAIVGAINERVWLPAFSEAALLPVISRRLAPDPMGHDAGWLTIYLDDIQDRQLAQEIARYDWSSLGMRVVVSAQPRITELLFRLRPDSEIVPIGDFSSGELRRYLKS